MLRQLIVITAIIAFCFSSQIEAQDRVYIGNTNSNQILQMDPDGSNPTAAYNAGSSVRGVRFDHVGQKLYYLFGPSQNLNRVDVDGSNNEAFITDFLVVFNQAFAIDFENNRVFYLHGSNLRVRNIDGTGDVLVAALTNPGWSIQLDPVNNHIYFPSVIPGVARAIRRVNYDGTGEMIAHSLGAAGHNIYDLELDLQNEQIYYIYDSGGDNEIRRVDFDGDNDLEILSDPSISHAIGLSLDLDGEKIYIAASVENVIARCDLNGDNLEILLNAGDGISFPQDIEFAAADTTPPAAPVITSPADESITNDNTPTVAGSAERASTVSILVDGNSNGTTTTDDTGSWSYSVSEALADGIKVLTAIATDLSSNTGPASAPVSVTIDTVAPAAPIILVPSSGLETNNATPTISGTAEASSTISVLLDSDLLGTTTTNGAGEWSFTPETTLADNTYTIQARATDAAGNEGALSAVTLITIDTMPPDTPTFIAPQESDFIGGLGAISGKAEADSKVDVYIGDTLVGSTFANAEGDWEFAFADKLPGGLYQLKIIVSDKAGNTNTATLEVSVPGCVTTTLGVKPQILSELRGARRLLRQSQRFARRNSCFKERARVRASDRMGAALQRMRNSRFPVQQTVCNPVPENCRAVSHNNLKVRIDRSSNLARRVVERMSLGRCSKRAKTRDSERLQQLLAELGGIHNTIGQLRDTIPDDNLICS